METLSKGTDDRQRAWSDVVGKAEHGLLGTEKRKHCLAFVCTFGRIAELYAESGG